MTSWPLRVTGAKTVEPIQPGATGKDTYAAGRYLDLFPTQTGLYTIDFNLAYNPACAYSEHYNCPIPPRSNRLAVAVTRRHDAFADPKLQDVLDQIDGVDH